MYSFVIYCVSTELFHVKVASFSLLCMKFNNTHDILSSEVLIAF